jgi:hypothetical protein
MAKVASELADLHVLASCTCAFTLINFFAFLANSILRRVNMKKCNIVDQLCAAVGRHAPAPTTDWVSLRKHDFLIRTNGRSWLALAL